MAAVAKKHVQTPDEEEPQSEDIDDQSGSDGGSIDEGSGDEESAGEEAEDEEGGEGGGEEEEEDDVEDDESNANAGWAESMAKILGKKTESKSTILIKNKEMDKVKERERQEQLERKKVVDKRRTWEMMNRVKPDIGKDRETEKGLQRIATRGVVQLFNAVKKHQKTVDDKLKEVGGSERKKAKILSSVSKRDFIDVLRRTEGGSSKTEKNTAAAVEEEKPAWSVLRDDFMMGATMKDWDKDSDGEAEPHTGEGAEESDSD